MSEDDNDVSVNRLKSIQEILERGIEAGAVSVTPTKEGANVEFNYSGSTGPVKTKLKETGDVAAAAIGTQKLKGK